MTMSLPDSMGLKASAGVAIKLAHGRFEITEKTIEPHSQSLSLHSIAFSAGHAALVGNGCLANRGRTSVPARIVIHANRHTHSRSLRTQRALLPRKITHVQHG